MRYLNNTNEKAFWMWILDLFFQFPGALHLLLGKSALYLETTGLNSWKGEGLQGIQKNPALNRFSYLVFQGIFGRLWYTFQYKTPKFTNCSVYVGKCILLFCRQNKMSLSWWILSPPKKKEKRKKWMDLRSFCLPCENLAEKGRWEHVAIHWQVPWSFLELTVSGFAHIFLFYLLGN